MCLACMALCVIMLAGAGAAVCDGEASNARAYKPCPDEWLDDARFFVDRGVVPGVLIMVESPEWGLRVGSAGYADMSVSLPPDPGMRFRVGEATRLMLTAVILQLEHEGKFTMGDTIDQLLGEGLVPNGDRITLRDCLKMRTGLFDYTQSDAFKLGDRPLNSGFLPREILYRVGTQMNTESATPGSGFEDSDTGFLLAGLVVENCEGKKLSQVMEERIFRPLGMNDTFYANLPDIPEPVVRGYQNMDGMPVDCTVYNPSTLGAASAVVSTPFDTLRFLRELFEGRKMLSRRSYRLITSLANTLHGEDAYGMGLLERVSRRGTWRGCEAAVPGYAVMAGYYMQGRSFVLVFINTGENRYVGREIFRNTLRRISGCPTDMSPANKTVLNAGSGRVRLSWQAGFLYGDTYRVYVGTKWDLVHSATPENLNGVTMVETDGHTFNTTVRNLRSGRTYYWRVEASRVRPGREMENARIWRDQLRENNPRIPWIPVPETESVNGPIYSFKVQ